MGGGRRRNYVLQKDIIYDLSAVLCHLFFSLVGGGEESHFVGIGEERRM